MAAGDRDFYDVLGVSRTASAEEIQRAYRTLARRHHPDINKDPGAEERFKEISEAYDTLSNPETRRRYDRYGRAFRQVPEGAEARGPSRARTGAGRPRGRGGAGGRVRVEQAEGFGPGGIDDLFGSLFGEAFGGYAGATGGFGGPPGADAGGPGGRGGGFGRGPVPGADTEAELTLTVEEAYRGGQRTIALSTPDGPREYDVTIPPGVTDGQRIRLAGQGSSGLGGGARGDLYLVVRLAPHPRYRVRGRDITANLPVAPWEAALGARVPTQTPGGWVEVDVPPGSSCGRRLRLRGQGLPNPRGTPGDFYAEVRIMVPSRLSNDERELFEQLARVSSFDPREAARGAERSEARGSSGSAGSRPSRA